MEDASTTGQTSPRERREKFLAEILKSESEKSTHFNVLTREKYLGLIQEVEEAKKADKKTPMQLRRLKRFNVVEIARIKKLVSRNDDGENIKYYLAADEIYDVIDAAHLAVGHGGRDKVSAETSKKFANVTLEMICLFLSMCQVCQQRKTRRNSDLTPKPILHSEKNRASPQPAKVRVASPQTPPSTQPEVCLRWNSYQTNLQETFPSLLVNGQFVDVTLACEGKSIRCHKIILSACSNYLESLLTQNPCQHPIILLKDMRFWEVQALVDFMYRGEVNISQENLPNLLSAAEALQIKGLAGTGGSYGTNQEESNKSQIIEGSREENTPSPSNARRVRKKKITSLTFNQTQSTQSTSANVQRLIARSRILKQGCSPSPSTSAVSLENPHSPIRKFAKKEPLHFLEGIKVEPIEESSINDNDSNSFDFSHRDSDCMKQFYEGSKQHNQDSKNEMDCSDDSDLQSHTPQEMGNEHTPTYPEVIMDTDTTPN